MNPSLFLFAFVALFAFATGCGPRGGGTTPDGPRTGTGAVVTEETQANFEEAYQEYEKALQGGLEESECDHIAGQFEEVSEDVDSGLPEALFNAGKVWDKCGNRENAANYFERANEAAKAHSKGKAPGFAPALIYLGIYSYHNNDKRRAKQYFDQAREADRRSTEAYTNLGVLRSEQAYQTHKTQGLSPAMEQYREAQTELRRALAVNSDYMTAFAQMAILYLSIAEENPQMLDITELVCQQATSRAAQIKADPIDVAPIYNIWGLALIRKGDIVRAVEQFDRARELDPNFYEAHMNYGAVNLSFRGYSAAAQAFRKAIDLRPDDYQAHLSLGASLRGMEQYQKAKTIYEKAQQIDGAAPGSYYNLGVLMQDYLLTSAGDMDAQIAMLEKAKQEYRRFLGKCQGRREDCVRRRPGEEDQDMMEAAQKRIEACDETINGLREARELEAEAARMAAEAEAAAQQQGADQQQPGEGEPPEEDGPEDEAAPVEPSPEAGEEGE